MQINQNQIEELKRGETIEIEKEWVRCDRLIYVKDIDLNKKPIYYDDTSDCGYCEGKGEIPKFKVGQEIYVWHSTLKDVILNKQEYDILLSALDNDEKKETIEETDKLKIISETEDKWRVRMG